MTPKTINLPSIVTGDSFYGLTIGPITFNTVAPDYPLDSCVLWIEADSGQVFQFKSDGTGDALITIDDDVNWTVSIPPTPILLPPSPGNWFYKTIDTAGVVRTLYKGRLDITEGVPYG